MFFFIRGGGRRTKKSPRNSLYEYMQIYGALLFLECFYAAQQQIEKAAERAIHKFDYAAKTLRAPPSILCIKDAFYFILYNMHFSDSSPKAKVHSGGK